MTKRMIEYWVIPPEQDAEFVACMEDVLDVYTRPMTPFGRWCAWMKPPNN